MMYRKNYIQPRIYPVTWTKRITLALKLWDILAFCLSGHPDLQTSVKCLIAGTGDGNNQEKALVAVLHEMG